MIRISNRLVASKISETIGGKLTGDTSAEVIRGRADSRLCRPGDLYVALKGERVDGNLYVREAWDAGADVALARTDDTLPEPSSGKALIQVDQPLTALQNLAKGIRDESSGLRVLGITGSNGKTTTKEIAASILRQTFGGDLLVTEGNYNSDIGLPLTLLSLRDEHRAAVLEMGMNRPGEMGLLASIASPDVAVITNIGSAHVGMVGSREKLAAEKRSIFNGADSDSVAIIGLEEDWADFLLRSYPGQVRRFGLQGVNSLESVEDLGIEGSLLRWSGREIRFSLPGRHNLLNAMAAIEAALAMGASEDDVHSGLESVIPVSGRSEVIRGEVTVIRDGYNANPESLNAAFELFSRLPTDGRRVLILGEMLELGLETDDALLAAGGAAANLRPDAIFLFGKNLSPLRNAALDAGFSGFVEVFHDMNRLGEALGDYLHPGDLVLLKGSRGSALERLDEIIAGVGVG